MKPEELREKLRGAVVILLTPFNTDFSIDEGGLRRNLEFLLGRSTPGAVVAGGSLGECYAMSIEERKALFGITVDAVGKRVPVICGVNHTATFLSVDLARHAEAVGADGIMMLPPYYMTPNDRSILLHFRSVAEAISIGVMIYNNQWVTGVDLSLDTLKQLAELDNVVALKDCTPGFFRFRQSIDELGDRLVVLNCMAEYWEPYAALMGSRGFLTAVANWAPELSDELAKSGQANDLERGLAVYRRLLPYLKVEAAVSAAEGDAETIALYKAAMTLRGLAAGPVRPPLHPLPETYLSALRVAMHEVGVL
jgi:4-hydroxy-tetrahydrodipicolinate synthase